MAAIEFYVGGSDKHIAVVDDGAVPRPDELINIRGVTYRIARVTWAVDHADDMRERRLRANVEMVRLAKQPAHKRS